MKLFHFFHTNKLQPSLFRFDLVLLFCGALLVLLAEGCSLGAKKDKETVKTVPSVAVFSAKKGLLTTSLQIPGELQAYQHVDIYAKESGFVKSVSVDVGSEVAAGQLLADMDAPEINAQLSTSASKLKSLEALYISSKANYDRLLETSKTPGTIAPSDLEFALGKRNSDYAQFEAGKAEYEGVMSRKKYLEIRAPFSGVVSARNVSTGAYAGPSGKGSENPMFTLEEQKKLRLVVSIPEANTSYIHAGNTIGFTVNSIPNQQFSSEIKRLAGSIDAKLRSQRIEMDVPNDNKKLLPGMIANVKIPLFAKDSAILVPKSAIVNSPERVFVIRIIDHKMEWVDIKKGREFEGKVEIYGDIKAGDYLVKAASEEMKPGALKADVQVHFEKE